MDTISNQLRRLLAKITMTIKTTTTDDAIKMIVIGVHIFCGSVVVLVVFVVVVVVVVVVLVVVVTGNTT